MNYWFHWDKILQGQVSPDFEPWLRQTQDQEEM
jgi:hypothetical protein